MPRRAPAPPVALEVNHSSRTLEHLRRLVQAIHTQSAAIESATGLSGPQFWALSEIARMKDGMTLGELARRLALHKANAGRLADRLASKRLITRETPPDDRRVVLVRITEAGRRRSSLPVSAPAQARLLSRLDALDPDEVIGLERSLARLVELMGAEDEDAGPMFERGPGLARAPRAARPTRRKRA